MIVDFSLKSVLSSLHREKIDLKFLNPNATPKIVKVWDNFMLANFKMQTEIRQRLNQGHRLDFGFVDRTDTVPNILNVTIPPDKQIPAIDSHTVKQTYLDICMNRARELLSKNQQINVLWSGGLDSTVALFSLLRAADNLDQIVVYCSVESILESGGMYDRYIKPLGIRTKFNQVRIIGVPFTHDNEDPNQLYVGGNCGDEVFGPVNFFSIPNQKPTDPWYSGYSNDILDLVEPTIKKSPRKIETSADFKWWLVFNFCWTTGCNDARRCMPAHIVNRIYPFYGTPEFQTWSILTDWRAGMTKQHRQPAKDALASMIDYDYYLNNKTKGQSIWLAGKKNWYMTDSDYNHYYSDDNTHK